MASKNYVQPIISLYELNPQQRRKCCESRKKKYTQFQKRDVFSTIESCSRDQKRLNIHCHNIWRKEREREREKHAVIVAQAITS